MTKRRWFRKAEQTSLTLVLAALEATDPDILRHTTWTVAGNGAISVNMHGHLWWMVSDMLHRLQLPSWPDSASLMGRDRAFLRFSNKGQSSRPRNDLQLVWHASTDAIDRAFGGSLLAEATRAY